MSGFSPATDPFPLGNSATPKWPAGYVPTATEWSHWWSIKLDENDPILQDGPWLPLAGGVMEGEIILPGPPTDPLGAVTKAYVDAITPASGPFVPLSGGTMTGALTLASDPTAPLQAVTRQYADAIGNTANQALGQANAAVMKSGSTMTGPLILSANPTSPLAAAPKQYVDLFVPLAGGVTVTGTLGVAGNFTASSNAYANTLAVGSFNNWEWTFTVGPNGSKWVTYRTNWNDVWDGTTGTRNWAGPNGSLMNLDGNGVLNVKSSVNTGVIGVSGNGSFGSVSVSGDVSANTVTANGLTSNGTLNVAGNGAIGGMLSAGAGGFVTGTMSMAGGSLQFSSGYYWGLSGSDGSLYYVTNGQPAVQIGIGLTFRIYSSGAYKPGGGSWIDPSDARIKTVTGDYTRGLKDILALTPKKFRYLANNDMTRSATDREFVGFVAQDLEETWPSMVEQGEGEIDGKRVSDLRFVDTNELVYALVNAVQQLNKRLDGTAMKA